MTTTADQGVAYTYDRNDQLKSATYQKPAYANLNFSYDDNGNRTGGGNTPGPDNRQASDGVSDFAYDLDGNMIRRTDKTTGAVIEYAWDLRNRLTDVTFKSSASGPITKSVHYTYDALNRRIGKSVDSDGNGTLDQVDWYANRGLRTDRENAGDEVMLRMNASGNVTSRYLHGASVDEILAEENIAANGTRDVLWPLADQQGSVRDIARRGADGRATTVAHIMYGPFGEKIAETDTAIAHLYGYTGREYDPETGLQYNRARYYDPKLGRFISQDPMSFGAGDANLYRYVGNHGTHSTDPSGLDDLPDLNDLSENRFNYATRNAERSKRFVSSTSFGLIRTIRTAYAVPFETNSGEKFYSLFEHKQDQLKEPENRSATQVIDSYRFVRIVPGGHNVDSALEGVLAPARTQNAENLADSLEFALHLVPFGATAEAVSQGDMKNATISAAGDLAGVITFGAGKVLKVGAKTISLSNKAMLRAGQAVEGGIAIYRTAHGTYQLTQGEGGQGEIAEGLLRLLGFSVSLIPSKAVATVNAPVNGYGMFGRNVPPPSGPSSTALKDLFLRNAESPLFRARANAWNWVRGRSPVDWDDFMTRLRNSDFNDYASFSEARKSLGFADAGPTEWLFGLANPIRQIPFVRNAATRHELFHAVDDLTTGLFSQKKTLGLWLRAETSAHLIGGPLIGVPAYGVFGYSIYVGLNGLHDWIRGDQ